jgi:hypothetical protein
MPGVLLPALFVVSKANFLPCHRIKTEPHDLSERIICFFKICILILKMFMSRKGYAAFEKVFQE